jgi:uncharacterized sporulation protein YeaH/YhbH (DUF444 family)
MLRRTTRNRPAKSMSPHLQADQLAEPAAQPSPQRAQEERMELRIVRFDRRQQRLGFKTCQRGDARPFRVIGEPHVLPHPERRIRDDHAILDRAR